MGSTKRSMQRRRGVVLGATLLSLALVAGACSSNSSNKASNGTEAPSGNTTGGSTAGTSAGTTPATEAPKPVDGGTLRIGLEADVDGLNPTSSAFSAPGYSMGNAVFDTLAALDKNGKAVPYLAESFTPSADFKSWTVKLRPGIKFHDGADLNSAALLKAFEAQHSAALVGLAVRPFFPEKDAAVIVDDLSVKFNLLEPNAYFPVALTSQLGMVPSPKWLDAAAADPTKNQEPVGTGPFKFDSRVQDNVTRFVRNDSWWGGKVHLDAVEFYPVPDPANALELLNNDSLDGMVTTDQAAIKDLKSNDKVTNILDDTGEESFEMINSAKPPFDDIRVRQALAFATPKKNYLDLIGLGISRSADSEFTPESPYYNADVKQEADQPDKAVALVKAYCADKPANCTNGKVNMEYQYTGPSVVGQRVADMFNEAWGVAFNVTFDMKNQQDHIQEVALGAYNVAGWRQFGAADPWADNVWLLCRTVGGISLNWPRYCDPARDTMLLDAEATTDQAKRVELYKKVAQNMHDAYTYIFLTHTTWAITFVNNVHGSCDHKSPEGVELKCADNGRTWYDTVWMDK